MSILSDHLKKFLPVRTEGEETIVTCAKASELFAPEDLSDAGEDLSRTKDGGFVGSLDEAYILVGVTNGAFAEDLASILNAVWTIERSCPGELDGLLARAKSSECHAASEV